MSNWISAFEASRLAKDAGYTERDLIDWARFGKLKARAQSGAFSDDNSCITREFPKDPPTDEIERAVMGSWPDIPSGYWEAKPHDAIWGTGTFASRLKYWNDYYQSYEYEGVELFEVTFHSDELDALLNGRQPKAAMAQPPKERWQRQRVSERQRAAFQFLEKCRTNPPKGWPLGPMARHKCYLNWAGGPKHEALGRSAFDKWANRHADGWRVAGAKWEHAG